MIYVTGDLHGEVDIEKLSNKNWASAKETTDKDYLIILGDFGLPFLDKEINEDGTPAKGPYKYWIEWLASKPFTILWVDGNHDNHPFWNRQEVSEWHGGKVHIHPHAKNIIHLMRGEIYDIEDKKYFAFGGAPSHDKGCRIEGRDWWPEEEASREETEHAISNLEKCGNQVDYILTHTIPKDVIAKKFFSDSESYTEKFFQHIKDTVDYKMWFAGHFHVNSMYPEYKLYVLYKSVYTIDQCVKRLDDYNKMLESGFYKNCGKQILTPER